MNLSKYKVILSVACLFTFLACEDFIGGDINIDPNKPASVPISGILPQIQISLADSYGGSFSRWNSMFVQHVEGVARQWSGYNQYVIPPTRFDDVWGDYFENVLVELNTVKAVSEENGYNHYLGVVQVMEAFFLLTAVDSWGDIPYTESGLGAANINPAFDDEAMLYTTAKDLLTGASTLFSGTAGAVAPGSEDLYYGGDIEGWERAINALLARYYLHTGDYAQALTSAQSSFTKTSENMSYQYGSQPDGAQWYRFNDGREGDLELHPTYKALLTGLKDTDRLGAVNLDFTVTHTYLVDAYRQDLVSYREMQFVIAECLQRTNGASKDLRTAYLKGIKASFEEFGFSATGDEYKDYVAQAAVDPGDGNITLEHIMTQKYIALFVQPEAFNDWRRTNIPSLTPVSGTQVPRRWNYSEFHFII